MAGQDVQNDTGGMNVVAVRAARWYGAVHRSAGSAGAEGPSPNLKGDDAALVRDSLPFYERMAARKLLI